MDGRTGSQAGKESNSFRPTTAISMNVVPKRIRDRALQRKTIVARSLLCHKFLWLWNGSEWRLDKLLISIRLSAISIHLRGESDLINGNWDVPSDGHWLQINLMVPLFSSTDNETLITAGLCSQEQDKGRFCSKVSPTINHQFMTWK